jgi:CheY-like chemotaxis protein
VKILLADDDSEQLSIRSLLLAHHGFKTVEASDRESALRIAAAERPDCAVVDLRLPTEEIGLDLIAKLKAIDDGMHIVVLTGGDPKSLSRRSERHLIDQVLEKGRPASNLLNTLKGFAAELRRGNG